MLLLERLDQQINAMIAAGGEVDPDEERATFEAALHEEPTVVDGEKAVLMQALGLR